MARIISEFINVLIDTDTFFKESKEWSLSRAFIYFGVITAILMLINWGFLFFEITPASLIPYEKLILDNAALSNTLLVIYFISGFLLLPLHSYFIRAFLNRKGIHMTTKDIIKITAYSFTPALLILWVPVLSLLFGFWFIYLSALGLNVYNKDEFGNLAGLSVLTRYAGFLLVLVALVYSYHEKQLRKAIYWIPAFIAILSPWIILNYMTYGSPLGALFKASAAVDGTFYSFGIEFYLIHWISIFGFLGILAIPGIIEIRKKKPFLLTLVLILSLIFFTILPRKEERYLLHFLPFYALLFSMGIIWLKSRFNPMIITILVMVMLSVSVYTGISMISNDPGKALKQASESLEGKIMTNALPLVHYYSGMEVVEFPKKLEEFDAVIDSQEISYILINSWEPSYPNWVFSDEKPSEVFDDYTLENVYEEFGEPNVWVYRI